MPLRKISNKIDLNNFGLEKSELAVLRRLSSARKIQDFLDTLSINFENDGETNMSPRLVLRKRTAHCLEAALLAGLALWVNGEDPYIMDLKSYDGDDHIVALYKKNGYYGAISKTNHAVLRFRDPVYKTLRELALSYFHEYINTKTGEKTLRSYSKPFSLRKLSADFGVKNRAKIGAKKAKNGSRYANWITSEENLDWLPEMIDKSPHCEFLPGKARKNLKELRHADKVELLAGRILEWKNM